MTVGSLDLRDFRNLSNFALVMGKTEGEIIEDFYKKNVNVVEMFKLINLIVDGKK